MGGTIPAVMARIREGRDWLFPLVFVVLLVVFLVQQLWIDSVVVGVFLVGFLGFLAVVRGCERNLFDKTYAPPVTDGISREPSEAMVALDQFDALIQNARPIPLTDQVWVGRLKLEVSLDRLRRTGSHEPSEVAAMVDELDALVQRAKPIPLTEQLRIDRAAIYDVLDRMRATIADER
jgi:hypothetical protein